MRMNSIIHPGSTEAKPHEDHPVLIKPQDTDVLLSKVNTSLATPYLAYLSVKSVSKIALTLRYWNIHTFPAHRVSKVWKQMSVHLTIFIGIAFLGRSLWRFESRCVFQFCDSTFNSVEVISVSDTCHLSYAHVKYDNKSN